MAWFWLCQKQYHKLPEYTVHLTRLGILKSCSAFSSAVGGCNSPWQCWVGLCGVFQSILWVTASGILWGWRWRGGTSLWPWTTRDLSRPRPSIGSPVGKGQPFCCLEVRVGYVVLCLKMLCQGHLTFMELPLGIWISLSRISWFYSHVLHGGCDWLPLANKLCVRAFYLTISPSICFDH